MSPTFSYKISILLTKTINNNNGETFRSIPSWRRQPSCRSFRIPLSCFSLFSFLAASRPWIALLVWETFHHQELAAPAMLLPFSPQPRIFPPALSSFGRVFFLFAFLVNLNSSRPYYWVIVPFWNRKWRQTFQQRWASNNVIVWAGFKSMVDFPQLHTP